MEAHHRGWVPPKGAGSEPNSLRIYNSLTDRKESFVPSGGPTSKKLTWYSCGPTVYDSAHMGHSRNYVTIDILRRVLEDYFGYTILFVMNITDVEDKIVLRARRNFLLHRYQHSASDVSQVRDDAVKAVDICLRSQEKEVASLERQTAEAEAASADLEGEDRGSEKDAAQRHQHRKRRARQAEALQVALKTERHKLERLQNISKELQSKFQSAQTQDTASGVQMLVSVAGEQLALWQDSLHKAEVTDETIFTRHAARYEREFWHDMDLLGTRRPTVLTRVTEYMPRIVDYIQRIMDNGFAYASEGSANGDAAKATGAQDRSVYFDTAAFERSGHLYPKLNPWAAGSSALAAEGEANFVTAEKRSPRDFALWKAAKPGEPTWPSPWGRGRPGWHIECSAMASSTIGAKVDIHTGGEDLRFPHHDNELAQAEAYYHHDCGCNAQWVNYFMHSGHLCIDGLKMSKSTKNFITIREALRDFSARQLRLMFAMTPWNKEMTFCKTMREEMSAKERIFKHFFQNVEVLLRKHTPHLAFEGAEEELDARIDEAKQGVHECLLDNLNTAGAIESLLKLVAATNKYVKQREVHAAHPAGPAPAPHPHLLRESARFVTHILRVFGISAAGTDGLGFGGPGLTAGREELLDVLAGFREKLAHSPELAEICAGVDATGDGDAGGSSPADVLDTLTDFRMRVRASAIQHRLKPALEECDRLRDALVELGVRMEDRPDGSGTWVAEDPAELRAERAQREDAARSAARAKQVKALEDKRRLLAKLEKLGGLPTVQEALRDQYSRFDGDGQAANPTHDASGNELEGTALKKARAAADKARKPRAFFDKTLERGPAALDDLRREVRQLEGELGRQEAPQSNGRAAPAAK